jgi:hypothetical protein
VSVKTGLVRWGALLIEVGDASDEALPWLVDEGYSNADSEQDAEDERTLTKMMRTKRTCMVCWLPLTRLV